MGGGCGGDCSSWTQVGGLIQVACWLGCGRSCCRDTLAFETVKVFLSM